MQDLVTYYNNTRYDNLTSLTIPSSLQSIGISGFSRNPISTLNLSNATSLASTAKKDDKLGDTSTNTAGAVVTVDSVTPSA